ncbi:sigma 54-interacting transcriptional regulator [Rhodobacter maris]|uniref:Transcriptional regulator with PAS, ATPase and Fis domain n=1 Tax=Rhodobacter maris TaxID=446682 RepID=A0A285T222_9RHOB|nr:sigma 54-interacting transcriptional regulator [Rhodobacter maris]SOC15335.1 transcriptional regulator with PAS, ATPase and Fis domain [Rhodobacter maris]
MRFYRSEPQAGSGRRRPGFLDDPCFPSFLNGLSDGAALVELDGRIRLVNAPMERLLRVSRADLLGSDLARQLRGTGRLAAELSEGLIRLRRTETTGTLASGRAVGAHLSILRQDDEPYAALVTLRELGGHPAASPVRGQFRLARDLAPQAPFAASPARQALAQQFEGALAQGLAVHLQGETGTGKTTLVTRLCAGHGAPVVTIACAALHPGNFDAELFGLGAAEPGRIGRIEAAAGGTLVFEAVDLLNPALAGRLLSALDVVLDSGGTRVVSTASAPLARLCASGSLPEALYFRLCGLSLSLPSLREEPAFLPPVIEVWLAEINRSRPQPLRLSARFVKALAARPLPGNIREMIALLRRAALLAEDVAEPAVLPPAQHTARLEGPGAALPAGAPLKDLVRDFEIRTIENSVADHGSKRSAAKALGIDVATLIRKMNRSRDTQPTRSEDT